MLPEAGRALLRRKWRGMGMIKHKAKQVRETWGAGLSRLRRKMLDGHREGLGLLYEEATWSARKPRPRLQMQPLLAEYWLACDDIAHLWKTLMHGAILDMDHPVAYDMVLDYILHVQRGYDTAGAQPGPGMRKAGGFTTLSSTPPSPTREGTTGA